MGGEQAGLDRHPARFTQLSRGAKHFQLGVERQSIAGFDLYGCHALGDQGIEPGESGVHQLVLAGRACRLHCREYAAARAGNLFIACARQAQFKFMRAVASVDEVRVAID